MSDLFLQRSELTPRDSCSLQVMENRLEESKPTHSVSISLDIILANVISLSWLHPANKRSIGQLIAGCICSELQVSVEEYLCSLNDLSYST